MDSYLVLIDVCVGGLLSRLRRVTGGEQERKIPEFDAGEDGSGDSGDTVSELKYVGKELDEIQV